MRLLFRKEKEPFLQLKRILGFAPRNIEIYRMALMHKSLTHKAVTEHPDEIEGDLARLSQKKAARKGRDTKNDAREQNHRLASNERLEFLGDAVLDLVVADILYRRYPNKQEGFLTTLRSKIVKRETLNMVAEKLGLDKLVLHYGRVSSAHNSYVGGNAFEAFVGAIYLDRGYNYCVRFMQRVVLKRYVNIDELSKTEENYKSKLIEWCQHYQLQFQFELVSQKMLSDRNTPTFVSRVVIEGVYCGSGSGYSKKESHQNAAKQAYQHIRRDVAFVNTLIAARNKTANPQAPAAAPESTKKEPRQGGRGKKRPRSAEKDQ